MIAKMKSLKAFGRTAGTRLSPRPVPNEAAEPEREQALDRVEAVAERSVQGSSQARMRSSW